MAGMRWFKVASDLMRHKKSQALARRLDDERAWAYVVQMWAWFCEQAGNGEQTGPDAAYQIARGAGWRGDTDEFCRHMVAAGFLDVVCEGFKVHDWEEWAGAHVEYQKKDADRKAKKRAEEAAKKAKKKAASTGHTTGQSSSPPSDIPQTSTGQNPDRGVDTSPFSDLKSPVVVEGVQGEAARRARLVSPFPAGQDPHPQTTAVLAALFERGIDAAGPSSRQAARVEAAIATVGLEAAVERLAGVLADPGAQRPLTYHVDAIRGTKARPPTHGDLGAELRPWTSRLTPEERREATEALHALHPEYADAPLGITGDPSHGEAFRALQELNAKWRAVAEART